MSSSWLLVEYVAFFRHEPRLTVNDGALVPRTGQELEKIMAANPSLLLRPDRSDLGVQSLCVLEGSRSDFRQMVHLHGRYACVPHAFLFVF